MVTWAPLLDRVSGLLGDLPTRVALARLAALLVVSAGMLWWASQHYIGSASTGWVMTTWETFREAEHKAAEQSRT